MKIKLSVMLVAGCAVLASGQVASAQGQRMMRTPHSSQGRVYLPPGRPISLMQEGPDQVYPDGGGDMQPIPSDGYDDGYGAGYGGGYGGDCEDCEQCCIDPCACVPPWAHQRAIFADFLYLRARDAEVPYAVPIDGPIVPPPSNNPIQVGRTATVDPDFQSGFRFGFVRPCCDTSSVVFTYTFFESSTTDSISTEPPDVIRSLVSHPSSLSASTDFLFASADLSVDFHTIDLDHRRLLSSSDCHAINYLIGVRYAHLDQEFSSFFQDNGTETVQTDIDFDGAGIRIGLDGERYRKGRCGLMGYAKGTANFVAGRFRANYFQGQSFDPSVVDTNWESGRVVTMLDVEAGFGWVSCNQRWKVTTGYMFSGWFNTVKTDEWINAVQQNTFLDLGDCLSFDGLVTRVEFRF